MTAGGEIDGIGHRVVHGGERFPRPARITPEVAREIEELSELAPLHNPHNLKGYYAALAALPGVPQVAVFDTAFHQTLPRHAYLYALPHEMCARHKLRRYGFHGTSHHYVSLRYARIHHAAPEAFKLITCHLGNGCSMCAVDGGRSIDTSMGFTPLEGLIMGTRAGDVDAAAVLHLMAREGLDVAAAGELLNFRSGLAGLSGLSNDIRTVIEHAERGHDRARLAIDAFCYRIKKYIGAYWAALNGADALIFTGVIGENRPPIRAQACAGLDSLGIVLDEHRNQAAAGVEMEISREGAWPQVWVIPTHEELLIARETMLCLLDEPL
jgi:acetate kinase